MPMFSPLPLKFRKGFKVGISDGGLPVVDCDVRFASALVHLAAYSVVSPF